MIRKCVKPQAVKRALLSLPKTLEGIYSAIIASIDEDYAEDARIILQWMVCSRRPLQLTEAAELLAFDLENEFSFNPDFRLPDSKDVLNICSSLITISRPDLTTGIQEVRLAHSTVREFLVTKTTSLNGPGSFLITEEVAQHTIAKMCLLYLLYIGEYAAAESDYVENFPLVMYAAQYWTDHFRSAGFPDDVSLLATSFFTSHFHAFETWCHVFNIDRPWSWGEEQKKYSAGPLYYASLAGLQPVVHSLLQAGADQVKKAEY